MNIDALNRKPALRRTPIGALSLQRWGRDVVVVATKRGERRGRCIHVLQPDGCVWDAVYGKAPLEAAAMDAGWAQAQEDEKRVQAFRAEQQSAAFQRDMLRLLRRRDDVRDLLSRGIRR